MVCYHIFKLNTISKIDIFPFDHRESRGHKKLVTLPYTIQANTFILDEAWHFLRGPAAERQCLCKLYPWALLGVLLCGS